MLSATLTRRVNKAQFQERLGPWIFSHRSAAFPLFSHEQPLNTSLAVSRCVARGARPFEAVIPDLAWNAGESRVLLDD